MASQLNEQSFLVVEILDLHLDPHEPRFSRSEREADSEEPQTSQVIRKY